ncbi:MAG: fatty acid desaturase [Actinobacteria bacterium]|nr:fatty acid desaturase [Actinomycetota bacterium]
MTATVMHGDRRQQIRRPPLPSLRQLGVAPPSRRLLRTIVVRPFVVAAAVVVAGTTGHTLVALVLLPVLYAYALCCVHCAVHRSLGLSARANEVVLSLASMLVFESGHVIDETHRAHHAADPEGDDPESYADTLSWGRLLTELPRYRYRLWGWVARRGLRAPGATALEATWHLASLLAAVVLWGSARWATLAIVGLHLGNSLYVVLSTHGPHMNWGRPVPSADALVKVRGRFTPWLLVGHAWHLEHHLYPQVPLPALRRALPQLDPVVDALGAHEVRVP